MSRLRDRRRNKRLEDLSEDEDGNSISVAEDNDDGTSSSYETSGEENESDGEEEEEEILDENENNRMNHRKHGGAPVAHGRSDDDVLKQGGIELGDDDWGEITQDDTDNKLSITESTEQTLGDFRERGERRKKEFDEYKRKLREDPAFTPNMGHFWLHDDRFGGGGPAGRGAGRGRDTDFGFGRGRGSLSSGRGRGAPTKRISLYGSSVSDFRRRDPWENDSDGGDKWVHDKFEELEKHDKPMDRRRSWGPRDLREGTTKGAFRASDQQAMIEKKKSAPNLKLPVTTSQTSESPETSPKRTFLNGTKQRSGNLIPLSSRAPPSSFGRERSGSLKSMDSGAEDYRDDSEFRGESSSSPWMGSRNPSAGFVTDRGFSPSPNLLGRGMPRKSFSSTRHYSKEDYRTANEQGSSQSYSEKGSSSQFRNRSEEREAAAQRASKRYLGVKSNSHGEEANPSVYNETNAEDTSKRKPSISSRDENTYAHREASSDNVLKNAINAPEFRPSSVPLESSSYGDLDGFNGYRQPNRPNQHEQPAFSAHATQPQSQTVPPAYTSQQRVTLTGPAAGQPMFTSTGQMFFLTENGLMVPADQYLIPYAPYPAIYMQQAMVPPIGADGTSQGIPAFPYFAQPATAPGMYISPTSGVQAAFTASGQTQHGFYSPTSLALAAQGSGDAPAGIVISATSTGVSGGTLTSTPAGANGTPGPVSSLSSYNKARLSPVSTKGSPTGASPTSIHSQGSGSGAQVLSKRGGSAVQIRDPSTLDIAYSSGDVGIHYDDDSTPTGGMAKAAPTRGNPPFGGYEQHYSSTATYRSGYTHYGQYRNPDAEPALLDDDLWVTDGVPDLDKIGGHEWELAEKKDDKEEVEDEDDEEEEESDDDVEVVIDFANAKPPRLALAQMMLS